MFKRVEKTVERYFGVEVTDDGALVVAERQDGRRAGAERYPSGAAGIRALRDHICGFHSRPHVCIHACGSSALAVAVGLMSVPAVEVTMISPRVVEARHTGAEPVSMEPEARAERLARRAEQLF